jgi:hypothetical protein
LHFLHCESYLLFELERRAVVSGFSVVENRPAELSPFLLARALSEFGIGSVFSYFRIALIAQI